MAMWRATQERGENPLSPLERGELSEPEFLGIVGAALSAEVGREVSMEASPSATSPSSSPTRS
jgi:hypothetical protein